MPSRYFPLSRPHSSRDMLRCVSIPFIKKPWAVPDYLQIVTDDTYSLEGFETIIQSFANEPLKKEWLIRNVNSAYQALNESVLLKRFKQIPWRLIGYELDVQFCTVTYRFAGHEESLPFVLTVTLGPRGTLIQLEGCGLNALVVPALAEWLKSRDPTRPKAIGLPPAVQQDHD